MPLIPVATVKSGYRSQSIDTSIDADVLFFHHLQQLSQQQKTLRVQRLDRSIRALSPIKQMVEDPISLAVNISKLLDRCEIPYYVGGSLASSLWGEPRYSEDLGLVIVLLPDRVPDLIATLMPHFYISEAAISDAVSGRCTSFNAISLASAEKIDLFVSQADDFSIAKLERRISYELSTGDLLWIYSPEDIILQKLVWGRGDRSQKQWRDVLGVIKVQQSKLDFNYLREWTEKLNIVAYLDRALTASGLQMSTSAIAID